MNKKLIFLGLGFFLLGVVGVIGLSLLSGRNGTTNNSGTKFSSCVVLDEEFCEGGEKVDYQGEFFGLGFNVPEGTSVYAGFSGNSDLSRIVLGENVYDGVAIFYQPGAGGAVDKDAISFTVVSAVSSPAVNVEVEKGELIAKVGGKEIKPLGSYNLILQFLRYSPKSKLFEHDPVLFSQYFKL